MVHLMENCFRYCRVLKCRAPRFSRYPEVEEPFALELAGANLSESLDHLWLVAFAEGAAACVGVPSPSRPSPGAQRPCFTDFCSSDCDGRRDCHSRSH